MKNIITSFLIFCLIIASIIYSISTAKASGNGAFYMQFHDVGNLLEVTVMADSGKQTINAVGIGLNFPTDKLSIESVDTGSSTCELFIENNYDNDKGEYKISCGTPRRDVVGENQIVKLYFKVKDTGEMNMNFSDDTMMLAADGYGTNILGQAINSQLIIN